MKFKDLKADLLRNCLYPYLNPLDIALLRDTKCKRVVRYANRALVDLQVYDYESKRIADSYQILARSTSIDNCVQCGSYVYLVRVKYFPGAECGDYHCMQWYYIDQGFWRTRTHHNPAYGEHHGYKRVCGFKNGWIESIPFNRNK